MSYCPDCKNYGRPKCRCVHTGPDRNVCDYFDCVPHPVKEKPVKVNTFWMVWNPGNRAPTVKHKTENLALNEAKRLAGKHPGDSFIVLRSVTEARAEVIVSTESCVQTEQAQPRPRIKAVTHVYIPAKGAYRLVDHFCDCGCRGVFVDPWVDEKRFYAMGEYKRVTR